MDEKVDLTEDERLQLIEDLEFIVKFSEHLISKRFFEREVRDKISEMRSESIIFIDNLTRQEDSTIYTPTTLESTRRFVKDCKTKIIPMLIEQKPMSLSMFYNYLRGFK